MNVATPLPVTPKKATREFVGYIHHFRGLAIIFVVAGHLLLNWPEDSITHLFFRVFWENGSVLFVFIAGYLFQYLSKKFEYKSYLVKKFQNVILPYFIISIPMIIYRLVSNDLPGYILGPHPDFASWPTWEKISYFIFRGAHSQQLWFVPMITLFYFASPLLIFIDRRPKLYYLLFLFIGLSLYVEREPFSDILKMFVHFFSIYLFGMFMSRYRNEYLEFAKKYWVIISVATIAFFTLNLYYYETYNSPLSYLHKMLFCCFFIYWLWKLDKYVPPFFSLLAYTSFGIFFIHYYIMLVIKAVYEKLFHQEIPGNVLYWLIDLLLVFVISILIIKTVQKLFPKRSRYLIGC